MLRPGGGNTLRPTACISRYGLLAAALISASVAGCSNYLVSNDHLTHGVIRPTDACGGPAAVTRFDLAARPPPQPRHGAKPSSRPAALREEAAARPPLRSLGAPLDAADVARPMAAPAYEARPANRVGTAAVGASTRAYAPTAALYEAPPRTFDQPTARVERMTIERALLYVFRGMAA